MYSSQYPREKHDEIIDLAYGFNKFRFLLDKIYNVSIRFRLAGVPVKIVILIVITTEIVARFRLRQKIKKEKKYKVLYKSTDVCNFFLFENLLELLLSINSRNAND